MREFDRRRATLRGRSSTRRLRSAGDFRLLAPLVAVGLAVVGCETVVQAPIGDQSAPPGLYGDCERASQAYCKLVVEAKRKEFERCVAEYTFECVSGTR